ncbi:MAG: DUF5107 domain-containing protein [Anaerolineae bacterium]|nr:DUF5107 domain-containing protein [Anaerolineae bacterium]
MNRIVLLFVIFVSWIVLSSCTMVISSQPPETTATLAAMENISSPYVASTFIPTQVPMDNSPTSIVSATSNLPETTPTLDQTVISPSTTITPSLTDVPLTQTPTILPQESLISLTTTLAAVDSTLNSTMTVTPTPLPAVTDTLIHTTPLSFTNENPKVYETALTINTFDYEPALIPTTPEDIVYPYPRMDHNQVGPPSPKSHRAIILENQYLQLTVLPDLGGRIYRWIDKASGKNLFYENPVIKPTTWGNRGWWLATGGMEWALPMDEHGLSEASPWVYQLHQGPDFAGVTLTDTEENSGLVSEIGITLDGEHAYFTLSPRIYNPTQQPINYKFWLNGMFGLGSQQPGTGIDLVLPGKQVTIHSTSDSSLPGEGQLMDWPVFDNRDFSAYDNWNKYLGVFAAPSAQEDYMGAYNHQTNLGVVRIFPHLLVKGAKIFGPGDLSSTLWTTDDSRYFELWGGLAPTFQDEVTLEPDAWVAWQEKWYALGDMGGFSFANDEAALNLGITNSSIQVAAASTYPINGSQLVLWQNGQEVIRWPFSLTPISPFRGSYTPDGNSSSWGVSLLDETGREIANLGQTQVVTTINSSAVAIPAAFNQLIPTPTSVSQDFAPTPTSTASSQRPIPTPTATPQNTDLLPPELFVTTVSIQPTPAGTPTPTPVKTVPWEWDPRLDDLGIEITRAKLDSGQPIYRLISARYLDETEAQGLHHVFVEVLDEDGQRIVGQPVTLAWSDGEGTMITEDKPYPEYAASAPLYGEISEGSYEVEVKNAFSDKISGLGLPGKHHVSYQLTFQRGVETTTNPVPPATDYLSPTPEVTSTPTSTIVDKNGVIWDSRLDDLGITMVSATPVAGKPLFKLVKVEYQNEQESQGLHHIFVEVLDENSQRIVGQPVSLTWSDGKGTMITEDKPYPEYAANSPMYGEISEAKYDVYVEDSISDKISGLGLPGKRHVNYLLTFQRINN